MKNRTVVAFETLAKSKDIVIRSQPKFYPTGTFWLQAFCKGEKCLELLTTDKAGIINKDLYGQPDLILVKDAVLSTEEWDILSDLVKDNDLYLIHHNSSIEVNTKNSNAIRSHPILQSLLRYSINQAHLEGEFYFEDLVRLFESVEKNDPGRYQQVFSQLIVNRFPDPVLEAKLDLLHQCLEWRSAINACLPALLQHNYANAFANFQNGLDAENHNDRLRELRDQLLPQ